MKDYTEFYDFDGCSICLTAENHKRRIYYKYYQYSEDLPQGAKFQNVNIHREFSQFIQGRDWNGKEWVRKEYVEKKDCVTIRSPSAAAGGSYSSTGINKLKEDQNFKYIEIGSNLKESLDHILSHVQTGITIEEFFDYVQKIIKESIECIKN